MHVQPGAKRNGLVGEHDGRLKLAVQAPPLDGRANEAVAGVLAEKLGEPRRAFTLEAGAASRDKRLAVATDLPVAEVVRRLLPKPK